MKCVYMVLMLLMIKFALADLVIPGDPAVTDTSYTFKDITILVGIPLAALFLMFSPILYLLFRKKLRKTKN